MEGLNLKQGVINRGSEWRKWDLHVHTASSFDYKYKENDADEVLVEAWKNQDIKAVAITDHFIIDANRIKHIRELVNDEITVFPGVELRTDKGGTNIHVILIFDDKISIEELSRDFESIMLRQKAKPNQHSNENIYWDYEDIKEFAKMHNGLISIHAGKKSNGLDEMITNALAVNMAVKCEYAESVDMFEGSKKQDLIDYRDHVFKFITERPVLICSDNHNPKNYKLKENLWIKADRSFEGLKQAVIHPRERVYIGEEPPKITSIRRNPEKYISNVIVRKREEFLNEDTWFDFDIKLNPGLTTVIGNKGSGKSALSDLLGYLGKSENQEHFSFLSKNRFAKEDKKFNLDYEGELSFYDGERLKSDDFSLLKEIPNIQFIRYLPQRYIEETCNSLGQKFQNEIDSVIFSYVDVSKRGGAKNLHDLVENKQVILASKMEMIKQELSLVNAEIIELERQKSSSYRKKVEENLEYWTNELRRHQTNKPVEVPKPAKEDENLKYIKLIEEYTKLINENNRIIEKKISDISHEKKCINDLTTYLGEINFENNKIQELQQKGDSLNTRYNLKPEVRVSLLAELEGVKRRIEESENNVENAEELISDSFDIYKYIENNSDQVLDDDFNQASSLRHKNFLLEIKISKIREKLDRPQLLYQQYLDELQSWEYKKTKIVGSEEIVDSLTYVRAESEFIKKHLDNRLKEKKEVRKEKIRELYNLFIEKKSILDEIYQPVEEKLKVILMNIKDKVEFKASLTVDSDFSSNLLVYINQSTQSKFRGKSEGREFVDATVRTYDISRFDGAYGLINNLMEAITEDEDKADILVKRRLECYDYICSLSYLNVGFSLKMGEKKLEQLSPGEKGSVLLIFYLALDQEEKPLIIDQPEDNLDNQSVFDKLVPCVLEAKKNRQVILITHNPNLAIACDSELIVYCENSGNHIEYLCGAIENNFIRDKMVDILEGTMPAFDLRTSKYKGVHFSSEV